ncbi:MAG: hypothetical protein H6823_18845 [Planctomycetaceae bacterium]|nr:hypothetical protein [Planctomycetales bacterium]MCB9940301.1 hypothetical protein [Planctomycetaceae bacterium]
MKGSGGTEGGVGQFFIGLVLAGLAIYLFFDSVRVTTGVGLVSGGVHALMGRRGGGGGFGETTSMGIIFVPFVIAVIALFYDAKKKWGWWLLYFSVAVIGVEILSRIRFFMNTKLTHLLGMMVLFAAGIGLILRSLRDESKRANHEASQQTDGADVEDDAKA